MLDKGSEQLQRSDDGEILTVRIPMKFARVGGRKVIIAPETTAPVPRPREPNSVLVKAIARAHRWVSLLETGAFPSVEELARAEKIHPSYVYRLLRLTVLAPDVVEAVLNGTQPKGCTLENLCGIVSSNWSHQQVTFRL